MAECGFLCGLRYGQINRGRSNVEMFTVVAVNITGWLVTGYLMKGYIDRQKETELIARNAMNRANELHIEQVKLKEQLTGIGTIVDKIDKKLDQNQRDMIQELKTEINNLRK